ncbi:hypothetical protein COCMIDRAFT_28892 [Bipolaris oryzae ATCC 44560]|uniref:Uncharacterized protein n=1 Tax=Bipolaris oryzae ATCC 44560 TaxID=930090 RepID=W6Z4H8_COCMI|nr:uncharacterized protein COCMIDRAFT_28892 [Bipolaris oryzae ATCC 44560]EUC42514.1 hypothetical protein COCMIDRAFT_28892 [Bipolaris oryzae ATCC 44560]
MPMPRKFEVINGAYTHIRREGFIWRCSSSIRGIGSRSQVFLFEKEGFFLGRRRDRLMMTDGGNIIGRRDSNSKIVGAATQEWTSGDHDDCNDDIPGLPSGIAPPVLCQHLVSRNGTEVGDGDEQLEPGAKKKIKGPYDVHYTGISLFGAVPSFGDDKIIIGEVIAGGGDMTVVVVWGGIKHGSGHTTTCSDVLRSPECVMQH